MIYVSGQAILLESKYQRTIWTLLHIGWHRVLSFWEGRPINNEEANGWISNHMPSKVWDKIMYPFRNFNRGAVKVWEWISYFIPRFIMDAIISSCLDLCSFNGCHVMCILVLWFREYTVHCQASVRVMVAEDVLPIWHQGICNHHGDVIRSADISYVLNLVLSRDAIWYLTTKLIIPSNGVLKV